MRQKLNFKTIIILLLCSACMANITAWESYVPITDGAIDLGTTGVRWRFAYIDKIYATPKTDVGVPPISIGWDAGLGFVATDVPISGAEQIALWVNASQIQTWARTDDPGGVATSNIDANVDIDGTFDLSSTALIDSTLTLASGSITDSGGAISFGDENLSTTLDMAAGTVTLPITTSTLGKVIQNSQDVIHFFRPTQQVSTKRNLFIGEGAGNFTMNNTVSSFHAGNNVGLGAVSLQSLTSGYQNLGIGASSGTALTSGHDNLFIGSGAGQTVTSNHYNTFLGSAAGGQTNGSGNSFFGYGAGNAQGAGISNRFLLTNQLHGSAALELVESLLYGEFSTTVANQRLRVNAQLEIGNATTGQPSYFGDGGPNGGNTNYTQISATGVTSFAGTAGVVLPHLMQSDSTTQAVATANIAQIVTFNTDVHHSGITVGTNRFTITKAASYLIAISALVDTSVANKQIEVWLRVNGSDVANSNTVVKMTGAGEYTLAVTFLQHFAVDDYFEFWMTGDNVACRLKATSAVSEVGDPVTVSARPACPSIIMTCNYAGLD